MDFTQSKGSYLNFYFQVISPISPPVSYEAGISDQHWKFDDPRALTGQGSGRGHGHGTLPNRTTLLATDRMDSFLQEYKSLQARPFKNDVMKI